VRTIGNAPFGPDLAAPHDHAVAFYDSDTALQQVAGQYVRDGLFLGERVLAVVPPGTRDLLVADLGSEVAEHVEWTTGISYRELGAMFHGYRKLFAQQRAAGATVRLLSEYHDGADGGPDTDRVEAYTRFEAASNEVLSPFGHRWACLYDTRTFPGVLLERMRQAHPAMLSADGVAVPNGDYLQPADYLAAHPEQLPPVPDDAAVDVVLRAPEQLRDLRQALQDWIARVPVDGDRDEAAHAASVLLAVGEAATNALQHGRPPVRVRAWVAGAGLRVRVEGRSDGGVPVAAGYWTGTDDRDGMGLLIARGVADTVRVVTDNGITGVSLDFPLGC
jgi:anti-sigma regulatory factor (Ser/Thr protein kinase)